MFCNEFCDYFTDNNKIQANIYLRDAKLTTKGLSEICDQMGEDNKPSSWDIILSLICLKEEVILSEVSEHFLVGLNTMETHIIAGASEPGAWVKC